MKDLLKKIWEKSRDFAGRYPLLLSAVAIYFYYLLTSFDFFQHQGEKRSFLDYIMQFDSLFFMWAAAAALLQVQKIRKEHAEETNRRREVERVLDRQKIYGELVSDMTMLLQDSVNNPLAVISVTTKEMRRKFERDDEIMRWLDRIDGALQRIHNTIRDIQAYEAQKMIDSSSTALEQKAGS